MATQNDKLDPQQHETSPSSGGLMSRLAAIPSGKSSKWLVLVVWLVIVATVSPFAGRLGEVEENDAAAWLPGNAESFKVSELEDRFRDSDLLSTVIVYQRDEGLTTADQDKVAADRQALTERFPASPPSEPVPSEDGRAILYVVPLPNNDDDATLENVEDVRALVGAGGDGLDVKVTGPGGFMLDFVEVFDGIDGTLLIATASVVTVLLLLIYRSPFLWLIPLLSVAFALQTATGGVWALAKYAGLTVNGQSGGILPVLVFGVGTDYALLLIARYREELRRHEDKHEAMAFALRRAGPAILASAATVTIGLLCLLAADLNPTRGLGPVGAVGIIGALLAMMTLLPAVLVILGRRLFWPFVPAFGSAPHEDSGIWSSVGRWVDRGPRRVWIGAALVLGVFALGLTALDTGLAQEDQFLNTPDSILGQKLIAASYPAGASAPTTVIANAAAADTVQAAIAETTGIARVAPAGAAGDLVAFSATLDAEPGSQAAFDTIERLRDNVHAVADGGALVGGPDAQSLDIATTAARDRDVIIPLVLLVVLVILGLLLRAIVAPVILIATVVLSFAAALGASVVVFERVFGFNGMDPSLSLLSFVFLVALGIDYNIFLMSRVHEEAAHLGTRKGMLKGLSVTGGVITAAGVVLAATFSVFTVLPLIFLIQMGFIVAFGVLLDTLVVRSILVPALTLDVGRRIWWPSNLSRQPSPPVPEPSAVGRATVGVER